MLLTPEQLMAVLLGEHSEPVAAWTHDGDLIVGVYPQGETYEWLVNGPGKRDANDLPCGYWPVVWRPGSEVLGIMGISMTHYYLDPGCTETDAYIYSRLVKHIQQSGEHAMIHAHAKDADVFCMDYDCEVWNSQEGDL